MTLEQFTILRRDELLTFFKARFGRRWRQTVERQADLHPRAFQRWTGAKPMSLYRQIHRLETWARSIGFVSATDAEVQARIEAQQRFKEAAEQEVAKAQAETERKKAEDATKDARWHQLQEAIVESLERGSMAQG